jgi:ribosomal protein L17
MVPAFTRGARTRIVWLMIEASPGATWAPLGDRIAMVLRGAWGRDDLGRPDVEPHQDLQAYLMGDATAPELLDAVEAWVQVLRSSWGRSGDLQRREIAEVAEEAFARRVEQALDEEGYPFHLVDGAIVERAEAARHADVLTPAIALVSTVPELDPVAHRLRAALDHLAPGGEPARALSEAVAALESLLAATGIATTTLDRALARATVDGLVEPQDERLVRAARMAAGWLPSAAGADLPPVRDDEAWIGVQAIAALIARIAARWEQRRGPRR